MDNHNSSHQLYKKAMALVLAGVVDRIYTI